MSPQDVIVAPHHSRTVVRESRQSPYPILLLPILAALAALLACASVASASGSPAEEARQTARELLTRTKSGLSGGVPGEPVLVHSFGDEQPSYYVVPVRKAGRTQGLVGVSADGRSWQWYTDGYRASQFPVVGRDRAEQKLASRGRRGPAVMVLGPDRKLYWAPDSGDGVLVNADDGSVRTDSQVENSALSDAGAGGAEPEALDSPSSTGGGSYSTSSTLPAAKTLVVPHYYQVTSYYCGPASVQMLFDYYKPHVQSQYDIANVMNAKDWGTWKGAYASDLVRTARFSSLSKAVLDPDLIGFRERGFGLSATMNFWSEGGSADPDFADRYTDLKNLVNSNYPVLMLTWYDGSYKIGHFRVLKGYDDSTSEFLVHDPWYSAPYYGPDIRFKQSFLVDDLWRRYDRWATVISPWKVAVSAPAQLTSGTPFTVTATVEYPGVHPMEGRAPVSESSAALEVPPSFIVSEATTRSLSDITTSGRSQTVSWTVTPPTSYSGSATFTVSARGKFSGSSTSYSSYTDWIGGTGSSASTVGQPPQSIAVFPAATQSGPGEFRTLTTTYADPDGASDLGTVMLLVNGRVSGMETLYAAYNSSNNELYLRKADNSGWLPGVVPGSSTVLDNGHAQLDAARTTVTRDGTKLVVAWAVSLSSSPRSHNVYLYAQDRADNVARWMGHGTWSVNRPAVAGDVAQVGALVRPGSPVTIEAMYGDPDGMSDLSTTQLLINKELRGSGAVWVRYDPPSNSLYLRRADASSWLGPIAPGASGTLDNGLAVLEAPATSVTTDAMGVRVRWSLRFHPSFSGQEYGLYSVALDAANASAPLPWVKKGGYTVSAPPIAQPLSPATGQSLPRTAVSYAATYRDVDGAVGISSAALMLNTSVSGASRVHVRYDAPTNKLYLRSDDGKSWLGGVTPGSTSPVSNTRAVLNAASTTVSGSGTDLVIRWSLSFKETYSGRWYNVYGSSRDRLGAASGWRSIGRWVVNRPPTTVSLSPASSSSVAGAWVTFTSAYGDPDGAINLGNAHFVVGSDASGTGGVRMRYDAVGNKLWVMKADRSGWTGGVAPGMVGKISTGYGSLDAGSTTVTRDGTTLRVRWRVSFSSQMKNRSHQQYMLARDRVGTWSPTRTMGTWTVN
ncbi:MAG: C39 family peptidase [Chloroflexota bacterium]|nr:C39 family peptidase [Chloroflexota bacterium]